MQNICEHIHIDKDSVHLPKMHAMVSIIGLAASLILGLLPSGAQASELTLATSPALACLTLTPGKSDQLEYPENLFQSKDGGTVPVELRFNGPDTAPEVRITDDGGWGELRSAVTAHVKRFRLPCMHKDDKQVILRQSYVFIPNDGRKVMSSGFEDAADKERRAQLACISHIDAMTKPIYPYTATQGNFLLNLRFEAPDQSPSLEWLAASNSPILRGALTQYAQGLRMPCLKNGPVTAQKLFKFQIEDGSRALIRDMTLVAFLRAASDIPKPVYFDFDRMSCPFDLRINYYRPFKNNHIAEIETSNPARLPLIKWLSKMTLQLNEKLSLDVLGDEFTVTVPCGQLDL